MDLWACHMLTFFYVNYFDGNLSRTYYTLSCFLKDNNKHYTLFFYMPQIHNYKHYSLLWANIQTWKLCSFFPFLVFPQRGIHIPTLLCLIHSSFALICSTLSRYSPQSPRRSFWLYSDLHSIHGYQMNCPRTVLHSLLKQQIFIILRYNIFPFVFPIATSAIKSGLNSLASLSCSGYLTLWSPLILHFRQLCYISFSMTLLISSFLSEITLRLL